MQGMMDGMMGGGMMWGIGFFWLLGLVVPVLAAGALVKYLLAAPALVSMSATPPPEKQNPVVEEYSRLAEDYDSKWSFYVDATTRETMARLSVRPTDRVLDVGCGTGALLHQLARIYPQAQLAGVDPVPEMLATGLVGCGA